MRRHLSILFIGLLFIIVTGCSRNNCKPQTVEVGKVNGRTFTNNQLRMSLDISEDWFFVGNGISNVTLAEPPNIEDQQNSISTILTLVAGMPGGAEPFSGGEPDYTPDYLISFGLSLSKNQNANQDLNDLKDAVSDLHSENEDFTRLNKDNMNTVGSLNMGSEHIPFFKITSIDPQGNMSHKVLGIKNFVCYDLIVNATYATDEQLQHIERTLRQITFSPTN